MPKKYFYVERYAPAEAADTSGISTELQRDHRRRFPKWFSRSYGHSRFNLFECLQMRFVSEARKFGLDVGHAYESGEWVAHSALYFALLQDGCISGALSADDTTMPNPEADDLRESAAMRAFRGNFGRPGIAANLTAMIWPDGEDWHGPSVDYFFDNLPDDDPRIGRPYLAIDVNDFAAATVKLLPRPAVRILSEDAETSASV